MFKNKKYNFILGAMIFMAVVLTLSFLGKLPVFASQSCESAPSQVTCESAPPGVCWWDTTCHTNICGDGHPNGPGEQCDDHNLTDGDGCSSTCQLEQYNIISTFPVNGTGYNGSDTINVVFDGGYSIDASNGVWDAQTGGDTFLCSGASANLGDCQASQIPINVAKYDDNQDGTFNGLHINPQSTPLPAGGYKVFLQDICRDNGGAGTYMGGGAQFIPEYCIPNNYNFSFTVGGGGGGGCAAEALCDATCGSFGYSTDGGTTCFSDFECTPAYICGLPQVPAFIFITSGSSGFSNGNMAGIAGANGACMGAAITAGLDGTWKALMSDSTHNVADALPDNQPFLLLNGQPVANNKVDLLDGIINHPIYITENGNPYTNYPNHPGLAWTGSNYVGAVSGVMTTCDNWTSSTPLTVIGVVGSADATDTSWINVPATQACDASLALYCFSGDSTGLGGQEICDNGIDDNDNQLVDCADPQCSQMPICGGQGGQCINMDGILDGTDPFAGGQGEACDGIAFRTGHSACTDFGYTGGALGCTICKPDFSACTGGGGQGGAGQITVNLKDEDGNPYDYDGEGDGSGVAEDTFVVAACGNTTVQMSEGGVGGVGVGGQPGTAPTQSDSFYSGATIEAGNSSATIMGIPTPKDGEIFSEPCLIFLGKSSSLALGSQYIYSGGLDDPEVWTDYSKNTDMDKPMPPMAKYAQVLLGDPSSNNAADLNMKVQELNPGDLSGYICLDSNGNLSCDADEYLADMSISIFPMGSAPAGFTTPAPYITDYSGYYEFIKLPAGDYIIQAFGEKMFFGTVTINGNTKQDLVISMGGSLNLTLDDSADGCLEDGQGSMKYSFWPKNWNFDSRPVSGSAVYTDFTDNGDGTYTLKDPIQGFGKGNYDWQMEIPGCMNAYGAPDTLVNIDDSSVLHVDLSVGISISGTVQDENGDPVADFSFSAQAEIAPNSPSMFGGFVGTQTDSEGDFTLSGLAEGDWSFTSFDSGVGGSQRSFASGLPSSLVDGVYTVDADGADDVVLVIRSDKRVNITVTDGVSLITNATIDIECDTGKFVHLGHSNGVYTFLPPGETCEFNVRARTGTYQPLVGFPVAITEGTQPQEISLTLDNANTNLGVYAGSTFKADKTTTYPGGKVTYVGKIVSSAGLAGRTVTFTYPSAASSEVITSSSAGTCTPGAGTVSCAIPGDYEGTSFTVSNELTVDPSYTGDNITTSLNAGTTNIGNIYTEVVSLTINAPGAVGTGDTFTVYGLAYPDSTVTLSYIDSDGMETSVGQTIMEPGSTWYSFSGVQIGKADEYTLKATAVGEGVSASATRPITVGGDTPNLAGITMTVNGEKWQNSEYTGIPTGQIFEGTPFTVNISFTKAVTSVTGAFAGGSYAFEYMGGNDWQVNVPAGWTGYGELTFDVTITWDDDNNPATPDVAVPLGSTVSAGGMIDPSGYVYDTTDANRIAGVTATIYQLVDGSGNAIEFVDGADDGTGTGTAGNGIIENDEELTNNGSVIKLDDGTTDCDSNNDGTLDDCNWSSWSAAPSGQVNPQLTDGNGKYGWNVPVGWYRVSFQKTGEYALLFSRDVYVPPAETTLDLNIGAYDIGAPTAVISPADGSTGVGRNAQPIITFSEPMLAGTINTTNIQLLDGAMAPVNITATYDSGNNTVTLAPTAPPLAASTTYTIRVTTGVTDDSSNAFAAETDYEFTTSINTDSILPASTASLPDQTFTSATSPLVVILSASDDKNDGAGVVACTGCTIYYTTDGTVPTASSAVYNSLNPFSLTATTTIKFFAKDAANNSEAAPNSRTYTLITAPAVPTGVAAAPLTNGYISLTWSAVTGATSYNVYRSTTSGVYGAALATGVVGALYTDTAVTNGTKYYYKVSATNAVGDSGPSAEVSATSTVTAVAACGNGICEAGETCSADCNTGGGGGGGVSLSMLLKKKISQTGTTTGGTADGGGAGTAFGDIVGHWAQSYINQITGLGIVSGKSAGVFAPDDAITRAELTKVVVKAFDIPMADTLSSFADVASDAWYAPYIAAAKKAGIIQGYEDGTFKPDNAINRAEALKILLVAAGLQVTEAVTNLFPDVPADAWFAKYVAYAKDNSIVGGYADGTFGPGKFITRAEVAKIIVKILEMK